MRITIGDQGCEDLVLVIDFRPLYIYVDFWDGLSFFVERRAELRNVPKSITLNRHEERQRCFISYERIGGGLHLSYTRLTAKGRHLRKQYRKECLKTNTPYEEFFRVISPRRIKG